MSSVFWTTKSYIPYQSHNFTVDFQLYAIKEKAFYGSGAPLAEGAPPQGFSNSVKSSDIESIEIPTWAIKSIDMPTLAASIEDTSGNLSSVNEAEGRDPDYQDISVTFYAVDTPNGNIVRLLPRIFHAYYLNFVNETARIPFQSQYDKDAPAINQSLCARSSMTINLFRSDSLDQKRNMPVTYRRIAPVKYDIGNLSYDDSAIIECTMVFKYNLQDGLIGAGISIGTRNQKAGTAQMD